MVEYWKKAERLRAIKNKLSAEFLFDQSDDKI